MLLPIYNAESRCLKCGGEDISSQYHSSGPYDCGWIGGCGIPRPTVEHIKRCCQRCSHYWVEATLDSALTIG